ncbi:CRISPR-associated protein, Csh1 family [Methanosarcina mazei Tuc01]|uniref:CRISPR-associated protein, Csh1 family n=1 Tax=Methanosarcina mazei Tuc01 TaxID=1236903 RepID=M1Q781_METMZ|nr:CRISPR-associated protein, Csh1 family [Methanosarcina mazei Tuc01]
MIETICDIGKIVRKTDGEIDLVDDRFDEVKSLIDLSLKD